MEKIESKFRDTNENIAKAVNALKLSELLDNVSYESHKTAISLLEMYTLDESTWSEDKCFFFELIKKIELKFSN